MRNFREVDDDEWVCEDGPDEPRELDEFDLAELDPSPTEAAMDAAETAYQDRMERVTR